MRSTILILILLFSLLLVPAVLAEDSLEWYTKAQNAQTVGDYSTAVMYYNNALELDTHFASAYAGRAAALNMLSRYSEAIDSAESALAIKVNDPVALNARAFGLYKLRRYSEAAAAYDKLFVVEQNRKEAYCNQADAYMKINETDAAIVSYEMCTKLDSQNPDVWNSQGLAMMAAGRYDDALDAFDRATVITVKNATIWNNKGVALVALGKPTDALQCFNKALGIDPGYIEAQKNKADAMGKQQSFNISGTITPKVTISRIGTLYTTVSPADGQPTAEIALAPQAGDTMPVITTKPLAKKTTYSPVSPVTVLGALAIFMGIVAAMRRK